MENEERRPNTHAAYSDTPFPRRTKKPLPRKGEKIGGGFFVFRRGKKTGRISAGNSLPYEHPSLASAAAEAARLAKMNPGETFEVFETTGVTTGSTEALPEPWDFDPRSLN
ncbi:hypothetical protein [Limoniibacter endophyticus]|uniref:Uncharacterized protein n=1 Tax=Limoniibacter endophyticus TaxID=1565040 RepID=A0A8J3GF95_9HYPH|nr:hypothetical protein [Limoniibacter endophyticus]GHC61300.1 hypothetical protein GCM10010136_01770 [Limoniibacter endophyticus]